MGNEKFTKGEWSVEEKSMNFNGIFKYGFQVVSESERKRICYSETTEEANIEQMEANAALIAAAPEMYYCICDALTDLEMSEGMRKYFETVLKKARGEE